MDINKWNMNEHLYYIYVNAPDNTVVVNVLTYK